jgi:hypothetical protein
MLVKCMNLKKLERYLRGNLLGPGARLLKKKSLLGRGLAKVEKHLSRVYVIRVHPKAEVGRRYLLRIFSKTANCHRLPKKSKK